MLFNTAPVGAMLAASTRICVRKPGTPNGRARLCRPSARSAWAGSGWNVCAGSESAAWATRSRDHDVRNMLSVVLSVVWGAEEHTVLPRHWGHQDAVERPCAASPGAPSALHGARFFRASLLRHETAGGNRIREEGGERRNDGAAGSGRSLDQRAEREDRAGVGSGRPELQLGLPTRGGARRHRHVAPSPLVFRQGRDKGLWLVRRLHA